MYPVKFWAIPLANVSTAHSSKFIFELNVSDQSIQFVIVNCACNCLVDSISNLFREDCGGNSRYPCAIVSTVVVNTFLRISVNVCQVPA